MEGRKEGNYETPYNWEGFCGIDSFCSDYEGYHDDSSAEACNVLKYQQQGSVFGCSLFDDKSFIISSPLPAGPYEKVAEIQNGIRDAVEPMKSNQFPLSLSSVCLLSDYSKGRKRSKTGTFIEPSNTEVQDRELSTEGIMRVAGARFIQFSTQKFGMPSIFNDPFDISFSCHSEEEAKNVVLAEVLLASAEKVGNHQFDRASRLLNQCDLLSSNRGNPVQRVVYYFSEALRKRIDREKGTSTSHYLEDGQSLDVDEAVMIPNPTIPACQGIPFFQVPHFAGSQAIAEHVAMARKIHVIDLKIRNGLQWTVLMQALMSRKDCPLELLKITAVGTTSRQLMEDTGTRLMNFAKEMDIPFSFKIVMVSNMLDLKEDLFELEADEAVAVYSEYSLKGLIVQPDLLNSVMKVIKNINPRVMVMIEVDASHNSPVFVNRFIEALFYFSAYFDCFEACMGREDPSRIIMEAIYMGEGIRNIVACEGEERNIRNVKIGVWRKFLSQFGLVETELSESSLLQVQLVIKKFASGRHCTIDMDGKSLLIGWKGTPVVSISTWKFSPEEE